MEPIKRGEYEHADRMAAQDKAIKAVQENPGRLMDDYRQLPQAFGGRYVGADLVKELFADYNQSREARNRYNGPVHNSAAVLAAELFQQAVLDHRDPERNTAVFLTGSPGAGKTTTVMSTDGMLDKHVSVVYEGQMFRAEQSFPKIDAAQREGLKPEIIAVQPKPENALENTFRRFDTVGRGASIQTMSLIQGELAEGLRQIHSRYGESVSLRIFDYRDPANAVERKGWNQLQVLESEGDRNAIQTRLASHLQRHRDAGTITDACYRQAAGLAPLRTSLVDRRVDGEVDPERARSELRSRPSLRTDQARLLIGSTGNYPNLRSDELARAHFVARQDKVWTAAYDAEHGESIAQRSQLLASTHGRILAATLLNLPPKEACERYPELANTHASIAGTLAHLKTQGKSQEFVTDMRGKLTQALADRLTLGVGSTSVSVRQSTQERTPPTATRDLER